MGFKVTMTAIIGALCLIMSAGFSINPATVTNNNSQPLSIDISHEFNGLNLLDGRLNASLLPVNLPYDANLNNINDLNGHDIYEEVNFKNLGDNTNPLISDFNQKKNNKNKGRRSRNTRKRRSEDEQDTTVDHCDDLKKLHKLCDEMHGDVYHINRQEIFNKYTYGLLYNREVNKIINPIIVSLDYAKSCDIYKYCEFLELPVFELVRLHFYVKTVENEIDRELPDGELNSVGYTRYSIGKLLKSIFLHIEKCNTEINYRYPGFLGGSYLEPHKNSLCNQQWTLPVIRMHTNCTYISDFKNFTKPDSNDIFNLFDIPDSLKKADMKTVQKDYIVRKILELATGLKNHLPYNYQCCVLDTCPGAKLVISEAAKKLIAFEDRWDEVNLKNYFNSRPHHIFHNNYQLWNSTLYGALEVLDVCYKDKRIYKMPPLFTTLVPKTLSTKVPNHGVNHVPKQKFSDDNGIKSVKYAANDTSTSNYTGTSGNIKKDVRDSDSSGFLSSGLADKIGVNEANTRRANRPAIQNSHDSLLQGTDGQNQNNKTVSNEGTKITHSKEADIPGLPNSKNATDTVTVNNITTIKPVNGPVSSYNNSGESDLTGDSDKSKNTENSNNNVSNGDSKNSAGRIYSSFNIISCVLPLIFVLRKTISNILS